MPLEAVPQAEGWAVHESFPHTTTLVRGRASRAVFVLIVHSNWNVRSCHKDLSYPSSQLHLIILWAFPCAPQLSQAPVPNSRTTTPRLRVAELQSVMKNFRLFINGIFFLTAWFSRNHVFSSELCVWTWCPSQTQLPQGSVGFLKQV